MPMRNRAVLTSSLGPVSAEWTTRVCCWSMEEVIYVDCRAKGADVGTSWRDAYTDLQRALARAAVGCGCEIWVAQGEYDPGRLPEETFVIPAGVRVYGGFAGNESSRQQRNPKKYQTILTGAADAERNETVVRMSNNSSLDGFTITEAVSYGIYGNEADFTVENCRVVNNQQYGICAQNGDVAIKWCEIMNNGLYGIYHAGEGYALTIDKCRIVQSGRYGIYNRFSTPTINNSIVSRNGYLEQGFYGIRISNPTYNPRVFCNTIVYNKLEGIFFADNGTTIDPNDKNWPDIQNCILWYNNSGGMQVAGFDANTLPQYCCIYNPADPNGTDYTLNARNNFSGNPGFAYGDPNNLHLAWNSPCKDRGNPYHTIDDVGLSDMDGEERIVDNRVDIGADEICSCDEDLSEDDIRHPLDWDSDGVINNIQFGEFSRAWLSCEPNFPGDPNNWNPVCNLDKTGDSEHKIDLGDLAVFCENNPQVWLWRACWEQAQMNRFELIACSMIGEGGESMRMAMPIMESREITPAQEVVELDPDVLEENILLILEEISKSLSEETENLDARYEIKAFLEDLLRDLQNNKG